MATTAAIDARAQDTFLFTMLSPVIGDSAQQPSALLRSAELLYCPTVRHHVAAAAAPTTQRAAAKSPPTM